MMFFKLSVLLILLSCHGILPCLQAADISLGKGIPVEVETIYNRGLAYLSQAQQPDGSWRGPNENGVTGLCLLAFLSSGEDPNFGRYRHNVRAGVRAILRSQDTETGYFPGSMYHHAFAMLALAEAYGALDESTLWDGDPNGRLDITLAESLQAAIRLTAVAQRNNSQGGWRYMPESEDADTSVTGGVLMALLACKNAGLRVPEPTIAKAISYLERSTQESGYVAYIGTGGSGQSVARSAIVTLVLNISQRFESEALANARNHIVKRLDHVESAHPAYYRYYMAQALFQADADSWETWNGQVIRELISMQKADGQFNGSYGPEYCTAMALLTVALNYRYLPIYERN